MSDSLDQGILVTIIGEAKLQDRLIQLLTKMKVSGYTIIPAKGAGSHGRRMGDIAGYNTNIEIKAILTSEVSDQLMAALKPVKDSYSLIAYRQAVEGWFE